MVNKSTLSVLLSLNPSIKISSVAKLHEKPCQDIKGRQITFGCIHFTCCCVLCYQFLNEMPVRKTLKGRCLKGRAKLPPREYRNDSILAIYICYMNNIVLLTKNRSNSKSQTQSEINSNYAF